jgi:MFS family permease
MLRSQGARASRPGVACMNERLLNGSFLLVLASNAVLGAPMPMLIILGGLAGILLAPFDALATVPVSVQMLAGLVAAAPMSVFMGRYGRKLGFLVAAGLAFAGGLAGMLALFWSSFWMLCLGHACLGAALISFGYFRFAAAELVAEKWRPTAISFTLGAGLVAAVLGPEIFILTRDAFQPIPFAGAYLAIAAIAAAGSVLVLVTRYPPPPAQRRDGQAPAVASARVIVRRPKVAVALVASAASYAAMVLLMTPTPLAMVGCGFSDAQAGDVIRWHVIAMFAPSFFTGLLISRFGSSTIVTTGAMLLGLSAVAAIAGITLVHFYVSLILLGIGWNFGFVGATAMLTESLDATERPVVQGVNDTGVALASTIASFGSGALISAFDWTTVALASLPVVVAIVLATLVLRLTASSRALGARRS